MSNTIDGTFYDVLIMDNIKSKEEAISHISQYLESNGNM